MDPYATMYLIVKDPQAYNHWGIKENKNKGKNTLEDMEVPPIVDPNLFQQVNSILLQQMQVDDPTMGLYYFDDDMEPTLFLEARGSNPTTYIEKKVTYIIKLYDTVKEAFGEMIVQLVCYHTFDFCMGFCLTFVGGIPIFY